MKIRCLFGLAVGLIALAGCQTNDVPATAQPTPVAATATAVPPTTTPSPTPVPTATAVPTSAAVQTILETAVPTPVVSQTAADAVELGNEMLLKSKWTVAETMFQQAIDAEPDNPIGYARMAYLYVYWTPYKTKAIDLAEEAVALAPDDVEIQAVLLMALTANGRYQEGLPIAEKLGPITTNNPFVQAVVGSFYLAIGQLDEGNSHVSQAVALGTLDRLFEDIPEVYEADVTLNRLIGETAVASFKSSDYVSQFPDFIPAYTAQVAVWADQAGPRRSTNEVLDYALSLDPLYPPFLFQQARFLIATGVDSLGLHSCNRLQSAWPELADGNLCLGQMYLALGNEVNAQTQFEAVIEIDPENYQAMAGLAEALWAQGDCEAAMETAVAAADLHPFPTQALSIQGAAQTCLGNYDQAIAILTDGTETNPYDHRAFYLLGQAYLAANQPAAAETAFMSAISLTPVVDADYYQALGQAFWNQGNCQANSDDKVGLLVCAGDGLRGMEEYQLAINSYFKANILASEDPQPMIGMVLASSEMGMCDMSRTWLHMLPDSEAGYPAAEAAYEECVANEGPVFNRTIIIPPDQQISEEQAETETFLAVNRIQGVDEVYVHFETPEEDRVMVVEYKSEFEEDSDELAEQLIEVTKTAAGYLVLTDSQPVVLLVVVFTGGRSPADGYLVGFYNAALWYTGEIDGDLFQQSWLAWDDFN